MKAALLGNALSGKRTLFTLLTGRQIPPGRKPSEAVEGAAPIRDPRVDTLAAICKPEKTVYAENRYVLCPDASAGPGRRDWLEAARRCDLLCLVLPAFQGEGIAAGDAVLHALNQELLLADMETCDKRIQRIEKERRGGTAQQNEERALRKGMAALEAGRPLREAGLNEPELAAIRSLDMLTLLPTLAIYNVAEEALTLPVPAGAVAVSCVVESDIMSIADPAERQEFLASVGLERCGLDRVNDAAYDALGLMSFYTIGSDEVRAWTIRKGTAAPQAGGRVHTDIERGFIRAEIIKFDDFVAAGSEKAAKEAGKVHSAGRDYVLQDGDICHFLFNV